VSISPFLLWNFESDFFFFGILGFRYAAATSAAAQPTTETGPMTAALPTATSPSGGSGGSGNSNNNNGAVGLPFGVGTAVVIAGVVGAVGAVFGNVV